MHLRGHVVRDGSRRLRDWRLLRRRRMLHGSRSRHGGHVLRVGLRGDDDGRARLVGCLLRRRRRHVLVLVGTRLPSRLIVMRRRTGVLIVLRRIGVRVVHRRLWRRVVVRVGVGVVLLLPPRLGIHWRAGVHVRAWAGRHVMVVHHRAGGEASDGGGHGDLSRRGGGEERRLACFAGLARTLMRTTDGFGGCAKVSAGESRAHLLVLRTFFRRASVGVQGGSRG